MTSSSLPARQSSEYRIIIELDGQKLKVRSWPVGLRLPVADNNSVPVEATLDEISESPFAAIFSTARVVLESGRDIDHFILPFEPERGESAYYFLKTELRRDEPGKTVAITIEDITRAVVERRRSAYVGTWHGIIGKSAPMLNVFHRISMYGPTDAPVIITGETGTGKELIARALHETSRRSAKPFVAVNCTAMSPELFESELFGHEKGSFTGAIREHKGRFERAHEGTLFLDEIGDMPEMTQAKLLRTLEEGVIERVGSEQEKKVDVRVIAATNVGLEKAIVERRFRSDLFHRLAVLRIHLPALRERRDDIPLLVNYFLGKFNERYSKNIQRVTPEALRHLQGYYWPGNIRELRNVIERLVVEASGDAIGIRAVEAWEQEREYFMPGGWNADLLSGNTQRVFMATPGGVEPQYPTDFNSRHDDDMNSVPFSMTGKSSPSLLESGSHQLKDGDSKTEITADTIQKLFAATKGNLTEVARRLGVHKATLYRHMKQLDLSREDLENGKS